MPPKKAEEAPAVRFGRVKNSLKMGIVGLPNVGKSSLFNLLTEQSAAAENFPFCTIEPNESRCPVPDERYDYLCKLWNPPSKYPAYLNVTDIAGLVKGASEGAGLGNAFLSHILSVDGIYHCIRAFESDEVVHVEDSVDPVRDLETIESELCKKDLQYVLKAIAAEEKDVKRSQGMKLSALFISTMDKVKTMLEAGQPVRNGQWSTPEVELINDKLTLITTKPVVYLVNLTKDDYIRKKNKFLPAVHKWIQSHGGGVMIPFSVEFEQTLWNKRQSPTELEAFLAASNGAKSMLPKMITSGYEALQLQHFFTAGDTEVRAWTVFKGALAPQAAGVIHSDFEHGFIKAETVSFEDFKTLADGPSMAAIKAAGKYRIEGKGYAVQDGDIMHFQFNVTKNPGKK